MFLFTESFFQPGSSPGNGGHSKGSRVTGSGIDTTAATGSDNALDIFYTLTLGRSIRKALAP